MLRSLRPCSALVGVACLAGMSCGGSQSASSTFFSLAVLPDTQAYSQFAPDLFHAQTEWIAQNIEAFNIAYVLHVGDITNNNKEEEWQVARAAFDRLDGLVPTALAIGNHDMGPSGRARTRDTRFNEFFPLAGFAAWPSFGGVYDAEPDRAENSFHLLSAGGRDWLILVLEFGPRDDVIRWANRVLAENPCRAAIIVTHAYLDQRSTQYRQPPLTAKYEIIHSEEGFADGDEMWTDLVSGHANVAMVINGHFPQPPGYLVSSGKDGARVHQMMVDYQDGPRGGSAILRLLQFLPDGRNVAVQDYSPVAERIAAEIGQKFVLELDPAPHGDACAGIESGTELR